MPSDDLNRFRPLLEIRKGAQRQEAEQVSEAVAVSSQRDREFDRAVRVVAAARQTVQAADLRLKVLTEAGTTAAMLVVVTAYVGRCVRALEVAEADLRQAEACRGASDQVLRVATERLAAARGRREVMERYLVRARLGQQLLRDRRED